VPSLSLRRRDPWWGLEGPAARRSRRIHQAKAFVALVLAFAAIGLTAAGWAIRLGLGDILGYHGRIPLG